MRLRLSTINLLGCAVLLVVLSVTAASAGTLQTVQQRGYVKCGVNTNRPGLSMPDENGNWSGIDVAVCRAVAAAVFGDASAERFEPLAAAQRFTALQTGEVDVLTRDSTWTLTRDAGLGANFVGVDFYDGQGFMVKNDIGVDHVKQLDGAAVCVISGTTSELNLADYFRTNSMDYTPVTVSDAAHATASFAAGRCDALTGDTTVLAGTRLKLPDSSSVKILPELISKEPLSPAVAQGDPEWENVVQWSLFAMINAEHLGVNSKNVDKKIKSDNPKIKRLLGVSGGMGEKLGLPNDWAYQIVKQVGNYGEVFRRNTGSDSPLNLDRGLNALWTDGGIMYAPPIR